MKTPLTDIGVRALKAPAQGQITVWDAKSSIGVRISQGGAKTFIIMLGSGKRHAIGRFPIISLSAARKEATRLLAEKTLGLTKPAPTVAFQDAVKLFLAECELKNRPQTVKSYKRLLGHFPFGRAQLADVQPHTIVKRLDALMDTPVERHHAFVAGRIFFRWCIRQHYLDVSPMERMSVPQNHGSRDRVLTDTELGTIYKTALAGSSHFHRIVVLLILWGQRRGETAALQWEWIDEGERTVTLPASIAKNKRSHTFPYGEAAAGFLETIPRIGVYLFPAAREQVRGKPSTIFNGWGKPKAAFDVEIEGVAPWKIHDLRRTFSSGMAALAVPQPVVEKMLNHVSGGSQSPIAQVYNRYTYRDEMAEAARKWEAKLTSLLAR